MAIAFSNFGSNAGVLVQSFTVAVTINAGDTVVVTATSNGGGTGTQTITSVTDDGNNVYSKRGNTGIVQTGVVTELWTTGPSSASAATTITISWSPNTVRAGATVATYTGVASLGNIATPATGTGTAPSVTLATQDNNNFIASGMGCDTTVSGTTTWSSSVGNLRIGFAATVNHEGSANADNTAATPGSVTVTETLSQSEAWNALAIELRTIVPPSKGGICKQRRLSELYDW